MNKEHFRTIPDNRNELLLPGLMETLPSGLVRAVKFLNLNLVVRTSKHIFLPVVLLTGVKFFVGYPTVPYLMEWEEQQHSWETWSPAGRTTVESEQYLGSKYVSQVCGRASADRPTYFFIWPEVLTGRGGGEVGERERHTVPGL